MTTKRREFLAAGSAVLAAAASASVAPRALAQSATAATSIYSLYVNTQGVAGG